MGQAFTEIGRLFGLAYGDAMRLIRGMWRTIGVMLLAFLVVGVATTLIGTQIHTPLGRAVLDFIGSVAGIWLTAPYFVALYRFVLFDFRVRSESVRHTTEASRLFFAWSATLSFVLSIPSLVYALVGPDDPAYLDPASPPENTPGLWITLVLSIAIWIFAIRTITLLPAVANGKRPTLRQALAETRGHFWFIVAAGLAIGLPLLLGCGLLVVILTAALGPTSLILSTPVIFATVILLTQISISLSARLYQKFSPDAAPMPLSGPTTPPQ